MQGDLAKASIIHIAPSEPKTSIDQQRMNIGLCATSPTPKSPQ